MKIDAGHITKLLAAKHDKDVFVPECNTAGQSTGRYQRIDAWAMVKSWVRPNVFAYEIKVNRSDFLKDDKWPGYLRYCNSFYFACPSGLIQPQELPDNVGLIWVSKTGTRLFTKRKAPWRKTDIPESLWRYLLFSRTRVVDYSEGDTGKKAYWVEWLKRKEIDRSFGYHTGKAIATRVREEIVAAREESQRVTGRLAEYDQAIGLLKEFGLLDVNLAVSHRWNIRRRVEELSKAVPPELMESATSAHTRLGELIGNLQELQDA